MPPQINLLIMSQIPESFSMSVTAAIHHIRSFDPFLDACVTRVVRYRQGLVSLHGSFGSREACLDPTAVPLPRLHSSPSSHALNLHGRRHYMGSH